MKMAQNSKSTAVCATKTLTTIAVLSALSVVCSMFLTIRGGTIMKFSPVFIVVALAARRYGVLGATIVASMSDLIQFMMFPANGFSFGIFLSNALLGVIYGLLFYKKINLSRILIASGVSQVICTFFITTYTMVYIEKWQPLFPTIYFRGLNALIMLVANIVFLYLLFVKSDITKILKISK